MYCPSCGNSVADGLKYCNACGERLARKSDRKDNSSDKLLIFLLAALVSVVVFGMGILVGLIAVLLGNAVKIEAVMMIAIVYLLVIFGISFSLARQIPKLIDARLKGASDTTDQGNPRQLERKVTAQLEEHRQPVASVTDHTTRTLDQVPIRTKS